MPCVGGLAIETTRIARPLDLGSYHTASQYANHGLRHLRLEQGARAGMGRQQRTARTSECVSGTNPEGTNPGAEHVHHHLAILSRRVRPGVEWGVPMNSYGLGRSAEYVSGTDLAAARVVFDRSYEVYKNVVNQR